MCFVLLFLLTILLFFIFFLCFQLLYFWSLKYFFHNTAQGPTLLFNIKYFIFQVNLFLDFLVLLQF